jgi:LysR family transcriptional regulator, glycine cleavage system transcriptional activator
MTRSIPPLNALRAFEAAARTGSFKEAALELHVSQSAVSHQIKHLEEFLKMALFDRGARTVTLTEAGRTYLPFLQQAFDSINDGTRLLTHVSREDILTVRMYSTFAVRWLISRLHRFQATQPTLQVRLMTSQLDPVFPDQDIDLAVMIGQPVPGRVHYQYLFSPTMFPVCSPKLTAGRSRIKRPQDLSGFTILQVYPSAGDWAAWLKATGAKGIDPDAGLRFDSYDHALRMAARGMGIALAMQPYVSEDLAAGLLIAPLPRHTVPAPGDWYLVYMAGHRKLHKITAFQNWLLEEIAADESLAALRRANHKN